jgi:curved DNA-binding protein CbpA
MIGQLHEHPLAELLHEITAAGLTGALRLEHERFKTIVYLADGEVIYAASNLRQFRLLECLRRWQALSEEELATLPAAASDIDLGAALVAEKGFSREAVAGWQARQVAEVLRPALLWTEGDWEFNARVRMTADVRVHIDLKGLLLESARRLAPEFVASRFAGRDERLWPETNVPANPKLFPTEAFVLSRIDAPLALSELLSISTLPELETMQVVYTLSLGGLLKRERWPSAFSEEMLDKARSAKPPQKADASATATGAPQATEANASVAPAEAKQEASEEFEVDDLFARLAIAENYYQVLGVVRTAAGGEIKTAYHRLAKRFHPDRFHSEADSALHARIEAAFAQIAQAYETLKEKQSRAAYDLKLSEQSRTGQATAKPSLQNTGGQDRASTGEAAQNAAVLLRKAEDSFQRGMLALNKGRAIVAISSFGEAARLAPRDARYRAFHGRALAENEGTRRQAEAELKAAVALEPKNATYRVMLAELYSKIGLPRRAQSELERALAIDSRNATAQKLLDSLQATLKGQL